MDRGERQILEHICGSSNENISSYPPWPLSRGENGFRQPFGFSKARRQRNPADCSRCAIILTIRSRQVAAHDALIRQGLRFLTEHRAAVELCAYARVPAENPQQAERDGDNASVSIIYRSQLIFHAPRMILAVVRRSVRGLIDGDRAVGHDTTELQQP